MAEVLITLAIIGVVAAMTIPALISSHRKKVVETRLKKFYSVVRQVENLHKADEFGSGTMQPMPEVDASSTLNPDWAVEFLEYYFKPVLKSFNIEKKSKGTVLAFPDGSGIYLTKTLYNSTYPTWFIVSIFCPEYKFCKNIDENKMTIVSGYPTNIDGKNTFCFVDSTFNPCYREETQESIKANFCNSTKKDYRGCSTWLRRNGWEIPDDYPVKF